MRSFLSTTIYQSVLMTRRIPKNFWMDFWPISSLNRTFTSHGTLLDLYTGQFKSQGDFYNKLQPNGS